MFVHLHVHSCYSFLNGASDLESIVRRAADLGMAAVALTDINSLAAAVQFDELCRQYGVRSVFGAELTLQDSTHLTLLAESQIGYANLCRLISLAFTRGGRLSPALPWRELEAHSEGLICLAGCRPSFVGELVQSGRYAKAKRVLETLCGWFGKEHVFAELVHDFVPGSLALCQNLAELAADVGVGVVATNNVYYVSREHYRVHDVLRCIGAGITLADDKHPARPLNAEQHFKTAAEMAALFSWCPEAVTNTRRIAERCAGFALAKHEQITPVLADLPEGQSADAFLAQLAWDGTAMHYPDMSPSIAKRLEYELKVFADFGYSNFVLLSWDAAREARKRSIWFQLRGSAGCSLVLRCIGVSNVDPIVRRLPFARFVAEGKIPDIDMDFAHDRRDEMLVYFREKYGASHVAMCCTFHSYWARGAVRDIGKVLGLPADLLDTLRKHISGYVAADQIADAFSRHPELQHQRPLQERCQLLFELAQQIAGFPRHLGTHSSGMVVSRMPIDAIAPVTPSARGILPILTLDKDDIETIGGIKLDMLCLRIMSAVGDTVRTIRQREPDFDYDKLTVDIENDEATFDVIRAGKAFGVFQLESPAQMNLALMLQPRLYEDLTASIALIRPGPISSGTVQKFIKARNGYSRLELLHPLLAPILERTYGCVVFQEQVIQLIAVMTGWSESLADTFRKRLTRHHKLGTMESAREEFVRTATAHLRDLPLRNAERLFEEIKGWAGLGFAEAHAASFAITAARSAGLSVHYVADYFAGMLSNQPMGFWPSNSLVAEARRRGIMTKLVDINVSHDKCTVEHEDDERLNIRLGLRLVDGIGKADVEAILAERRKHGPFHSLLDFCVRVTIRQDAVESLVLCGAFEGGALGVMHEHRRGLMWRLEETLAFAHALRQEAGESQQLRLQLGQDYTTPVAWELEDMSPWEKLMWEWRITDVCAASHPLAWMRENIARQGILSVNEAEQVQDGERIRVAGLNIRPHRPPRKNGGRHLFTSVEDETDVLQCAFYTDEVIDRCTPTILLSPVIVIDGIIRRRGPGVSMEALYAEPLDATQMVLLNTAETAKLLTSPPQRNASAR